nr:immunoglobulin light chain junction region [Macaca mulatta]
DYSCSVWDPGLNAYIF